MPHSPIKTIRIQKNPHDACLSPAQKKFNHLIEKIEAQKTLLAGWHESIPQYQQEFARKLMPLRDTFREHQVEMVEMLDDLYTHEQFSTIQYEKISYLITSLCEELIHHGRHDLKSLYEYHSGRDFDEAIEQGEAMLESFLKQHTEGKLEDGQFEFFDPDSAAKKRHTDHESQSKRKKSARQLSKEASDNKEEASISKMIQGIYRQLVAALHPDRESDPAERTRKTELMQKLTVAYGEKDLAQLLEMQFSIEPVDQHTILKISDDRLKYYNAVLQQQLDGFRKEVAQVEQQARDMLGLSRHEPVSPKRLFAFLNEDTRALRSQINHIQRDLMLFNDVKQFKSWLKGYRIPHSEFDRFF